MKILFAILASACSLIGAEKIPSYLVCNYTTNPPSYHIIPEANIPKVSEVIQSAISLNKTVVLKGGDPSAIVTPIGTMDKLAPLSQVFMVNHKVDIAELNRDPQKITEVNNSGSIIFFTSGDVMVQVENTKEVGYWIDNSTKDSQLIVALISSHL